MEFKAYLGFGQYLKEKDRREWEGIVMPTQKGGQTLLSIMVVLRTSLESRSLERKNTSRRTYLPRSPSRVPDLPCLTPLRLPGGNITRSSRETLHSLLECSHAELASSISMIPTG